MPAKINLLPTELETGKNAGKVVKTLNKASLVAFSILIIFGGISLAAILFFNNRLKNIESENQSLKSSITNMQSAEEDLVLVKDRVQKIQGILQARNNEDSFAKQKNLVLSLPEGVAFKETVVEGGQDQLQLQATSSVGLAEVLQGLQNDNKYLYLAVNRISFSPFLGYTIALDIY